MPYHHIALATRDLEATHRFYTEVMGFRVAKVVAAPTPGGTGGWARHVFYDCGGGQYLAFWDIHDDAITDYTTDLSSGGTLPGWVNHFAWDATDEASFQSHLERWRSAGITVAEVDHGFCRSIYTTDPNGIMVEFCQMTAELGPEDEEKGLALMAAAMPPLETVPPPVTIHRPLTSAARA